MTIDLDLKGEHMNPVQPYGSQGQARLANSAAPVPAAAAVDVSRYELLSATEELRAAAKVGGADGMDAPHAVLKTLARNRELNEKILALSGTDWTAEMDQFREAFQQASRLGGFIMEADAEAFEAVYGLRQDEVSGEDATGLGFFTLLRSSSHRLLDARETLSAMEASSLKREWEAHDKELRAMRDEAEKRYVADMTQGGMGVGGGALAIGAAGRAVFATRKANDLGHQARDARLADRQIEGEGPEGVPNPRASDMRTPGTERLADADESGFTSDTGAEGTWALPPRPDATPARIADARPARAADDLDAEAVRISSEAGALENTARAIPGLTGGIGEMSAADQKLAAADDSARAKEQDFCGRLHAEQGRTSSEVSSGLDQVLKEAARVYDKLAESENASIRAAASV